MLDRLIHSNLKINCLISSKYSQRVPFIIYQKFSASNTFRCIPQFRLPSEDGLVLDFRTDPHNTQRGFTACFKFFLRMLHWRSEAINRSLRAQPFPDSECCRRLQTGFPDFCKIEIEFSAPELEGYISHMHVRREAINAKVLFMKMLKLKGVPCLEDMLVSWRKRLKDAYEALF